MNRIARNWRVVVGGVAAGSMAVIGFTGANASAEPTAPSTPAPVTVTQTVTVAPETSTAATPAPSESSATATTTASATPSASTPTAAPETTATATSTSTSAPTTTSAAAAAFAPLTPATSGTITEFLAEKGVTLEPQKASGFTALTVVLPVPAGWSVVPDPNVPDAFGVIADRKGGDGLYTSNAQVLVSKLVGDVDPREAISHGYIDSQQLPAWQSTSAAMGEYGGLPSSIITGTYREGDLRLNTSRRYLIAESGPDRYLVSLSVTTAANQVVATAAATDAILGGFRVTKPAATPAATPETTTPAPEATAP